MPKDSQNKNFSSFMPYFIRNGSFNSIDLDKIDVPYPLDENLVSVLKNNLNDPSKKTPNSFILYRKAFKEISIYHGFRLSASEISRQASKNWKSLADPVKQEYKKIAEEFRENTEKHAIMPSFKNSKNKWRIIKPSDMQRKINKKKKPSLDNTSELYTANLLQDSPMSPINAQENFIFSYTDLSYTDQFEELFTYTDLSHADQFEELFTYIYNLPETMLHVLNQNPMYPELPMIHFYEHFTDNTEVEFQSISTNFQETEYFMNHIVL
ncbi:11649_t:CDS:1 [Ambispora leptoticha]|uniref:11649_t:CDS:1 n=1 Tax=Ambispora leptoticha TaxID=144679 RepID=A0A9N8W9I8_9GLOM|nr:11649_t:CDS:1 [Ambispora leptoticha]